MSRASLGILLIRVGSELRDLTGRHKRPGLRPAWWQPPKREVGEQLPAHAVLVCVVSLLANPIEVEAEGVV